VHGKGLKLGIYSDAGSKTCAGYPGGRGFEKIDAQSYASWGVDYLKYDNCNAGAADWIVDRYTAMRDALNATGRPIYYSMCSWGVADSWKWGPPGIPSIRSSHDSIVAHQLIDEQ
jgi:alpha-galactosidase